MASTTGPTTTTTGLPVTTAIFLTSPSF
jgi:hypothetical protein